MKRVINTDFLSGVIFSIGLVISGMVNPNKVIAFLDILGDWDYSLALVMGGAVLINLITFRFILKRKETIYGNVFDLPTKKDITPRLLIGSSLFGIGWGMAGICPGPGIVNLVTFDVKALAFFGSMLVGMIIFRLTKTFWEKLE